MAGSAHSLHVANGQADIILMAFKFGGAQVAGHMLRNAKDNFRVIGEGYVHGGKKVIAVEVSDYAAHVLRSSSTVEVFKNGTEPFDRIVDEVRSMQPDFLTNTL